MARYSKEMLMLKWRGSSVNEKKNMVNIKLQITLQNYRLIRKYCRLHRISVHKKCE